VPTAHVSDDPVSGHPVPSAVPPGARPLVVTADELLLDDVLRLAAAAGVQVEVAADPVGGRSSWATAPVVLVGSDVIDTCAAGSIGRRHGVVVLARTEPTAEVWRCSVAVGAEQVLVLPAAESALVERLGEAGEPHPRRGRVLCCVGGRGGAGASVLAVGLAVSAARAAPGAALLVDLDPLGGGLDLALGAESVGGLRWPDLTATSGRVAAGSLYDALPAAAGVSVVSMGRQPLPHIPAAAARAVITAGRRHGALVVVDLPRTLTAAAGAALALADLAFVVVPAEVRACAAAAGVVSAVAEHVGRVEVVVRGPAPSGLPASAVAESLGIPLAGWMRAEPGLPAALDRGESPGRRGRGPLSVLCRRLIDSLVDDQLPAQARDVA
jgi:secretion/DNA translocation related CpaE-like protein